MEKWAWRHELCLEVLGIFVDALGAYYRQLARAQGCRWPKPDHAPRALVDPMTPRVQAVLGRRANNSYRTLDRASASRIMTVLLAAQRSPTASPALTLRVRVRRLVAHNGDGVRRPGKAR